MVDRAHSIKKCAAEATHEKCTAPLAATQIHFTLSKHVKNRACIFTQNRYKNTHFNRKDIEFMSQIYCITVFYKLQVFFGKSVLLLKIRDVFFVKGPGGTFDFPPSPLKIPLPPSNECSYAARLFYDTVLKGIRHFALLGYAVPLLSKKKGTVNFHCSFLSYLV